MFYRESVAVHIAPFCGVYSRMSERFQNKLHFICVGKHLMDINMAPNMILERMLTVTVSECETHCIG
jgi:hypothetical protein